MNRVIKNYSKLPASLRDEVYSAYSEGELERTTLPFQGKLTDGVIYHFDNTVYLIPISTIVVGRSGSSSDLDDDDSAIDDDLEIEEDVD